MSSLFSKALVYLGLVDEDQIEAEAAELSNSFNGRSGAPTQASPIDDIGQGRRVEPPPVALSGAGRRVEPSTSLSSARRVEPPTTSSSLRPVETQSDVLVLEEFADARMLADRVRDRIPVVLDMRQADPDLVRRLVDFSSGLIYALDGTMRRVGDGLVLVLPPRVTLSRDEKRRLASLGAYELDDID